MSVFFEAGSSSFPWIQQTIVENATLVTNWLFESSSDLSIMSLAAAGIAVLGSSLLFNKNKKTKSFESSLEELIYKATASKNQVSLEKELRVLVEKHWQYFVLPISCKNEHNKIILINRLSAVLKSHQNQSAEERLEICKNIYKNFTAYLFEAKDTIMNDLKNDRKFQKVFNLSISDQIKKIEILGEETHNKGKTPLLIEFETGKKFVFKPRSMINERLLCGHENSLLAKLKRSEWTYRIYDKNQYGYSEFIDNNKTENTFDNIEDIKSYLKKFHILEKCCKSLGITDLHQENIRTRTKFPMVIDAEVIAPSNTKIFNTGILSGLTAGYLFTNDTGNRIWFSAELMQRMEPLTEENLTKNDFGALDTIDALTSLEVLSSIAYQEDMLLEENEERIVSEIKSELNTHIHRIILIGTSELKNLIKDPLNHSSNDFMEILKEGINEWDFSFNSEIEEQIRVFFKEDVINNDVPVFYYKPNSETIYYHGLAIGKKSK